MARSFRSRFRIATLVLLAVLIALPAAAQTRATPGVVERRDPREQIAALLRSTDALEQAWGAWYAGRDQMRELAPLLREVVSQHAMATTRAESAAVDVALDALIQMGLPARTEDLPFVHERRPAQALILAGLTSGDDVAVEPLLLGILSRKNYEEWFAAANILMARRSSSLARGIIQSLRLQVHVEIIRDTSRAMSRSGGVGMGIGCGVPGVASDLPPVASYRLSTLATPGVVVLSTGPTTVYYRRVLSNTASPTGSRISRLEPDADDRLRYLAALAGIDEAELPVRGLETHVVHLTGDAPADAPVERIRAGVLSRWSILVRALAERGALDDSSMAAAPAIEVTVLDPEQ